VYDVAERPEQVLLAGRRERLQPGRGTQDGDADGGGQDDLGAQDEPVAVGVVGDLPSEPAGVR